MVKHAAMFSCLMLFAVGALAQVAVDLSGSQIQIQQNAGDTRSGSIAPDAEIIGITVINGEVFIDGAKVPKGVKQYTSKTSGKSYRIDWGHNGNVSVSEK